MLKESLSNDTFVTFLTPKVYCYYIAYNQNTMGVRFGHSLSRVGLVVRFLINPGLILDPCLCTFCFSRPQATDSGNIRPSRK